MRNLLFAGVIFVFAVGCNRDKVIFNEVKPVPSGEWAYGDVYDYAFDVTDTSETYRLLLYLEYATDYSWQNLYTSITTVFPDDSTRTDVISFELASKTGAWYGDCGSEFCKLNIPLQQEVKFPIPGEYRISFEQYMREEVVEGIKAVGLKLVVPAEK